MHGSVILEADKHMTLYYACINYVEKKTYYRVITIVRSYTRKYELVAPVLLWVRSTSSNAKGQQTSDIFMVWLRTMLLSYS